MIPGVHFLYYFSKDAFFVKDEGFSDCAHYCLAVHLLFSPGAEGLQHLRGSVRKQSERKLIFVLELSVRRCAVLAYSYDIVSAGLECFEIVSDIACFCCAAACVVFRIKIYDCLLSEKVF